MKSALLVLVLLGFQWLYAGPAHMNFQGRLFDSNGEPVISGQVSVVNQVLDHTGNCLLYEESRSVTMDNSSGGFFSIVIGLGAQNTGTAPNFSLKQALSNSETLSNPNMGCAGNSYSPTTSSHRFLRTIIDGETLSPDQVIGSVPYAIEANDAQSLSGKKAEDFILSDENHVTQGAVKGFFEAVSLLGNNEALRWSTGTGDWEAFTPNTGGGNVNADWTATSGDAQILNKPDLNNLSATQISSGTLDSARLDSDLQDLADGTLSASKVEHGPFMIDSAGSSGQLWRSDGVGAGAWWTPNYLTSFTETDPSVPANIKDGVSWAEVSGKPSLADGHSLDASDGTPTDALFVDGAGNVGVGTTSPGQLLHVDGPMRLTPTSLPGSPGVGDVAVDSGDSNKLKYYNGTAWVDVASGSGGGSGFGSWDVRSKNTVYQASTDGIVVARLSMETSTGNRVLGQTSSSNPPTTSVVATYSSAGGNDRSITFPVKKNDYWRVNQTSGSNTVLVYWLPSTGGGGGSIWSASGSNTYYDSGNVGVGVTSPDRLLHVNGPIRIQASALPGSPVLGDIAIDSGDSNKMKYHNGTSWLDLSSGGTPGANTVTSSEIQDNSVTVGDLDFASSNGINVPQLTSDPGSPTTGQIYYNTTSNKLMVYNGSTWVENGSGSSSTTSALFSGWPDAIHCDRNDGEDTVLIFMIQRADGDVIYESHNGRTIEWNSDGTFESAVFSASNCDSDDTMSSIISSGRARYFGNSIGAVAKDSDDDTKIMVEKNTDEDILRFDTAGSERMQINAVGNVGIGTTTPTEALDVSGAIRATSGIKVGSTSILASHQLYYGKPEISYSAANAECSTGRVIQASMTHQGKTGAEICALDNASDGARTTCTAVKFIYVTVDGTVGTHAANDKTCSESIGAIWPYIAIPSTPNSRPNEWTNTTHAVCCN